MGVEEEISNKITEFCKAAIRLFGKEISIPSNQLFCINQIVDPETQTEGEEKFLIQYGFPSSGSVCMNLGYNAQENNIYIDSTDVYAPPEGQPVLMANFAPKINVGEFGLGVKVGVDAGCKKHSTIEEMAGNPNVLETLNIAIEDLKKARIHGECRAAVEMGSDIIPCCNTTTYIEEAEKQLSTGDKEPELEEEPVIKTLITPELVVSGLKYIVEHQSENQFFLAAGLLELGCSFTIEDAMEQFPELFKMDFESFNEEMKRGSTGCGALIIVGVRDEGMNDDIKEFFAKDTEGSVYDFIRTATGDPTYTKEKIDELNGDKPQVP